MEGPVTKLFVDVLVRICRGGVLRGGLQRERDSWIFETVEY